MIDWLTEAVTAFITYLDDAVIFPFGSPGYSLLLRDLSEVLAQEERKKPDVLLCLIQGAEIKEVRNLPMDDVLNQFCNGERPKCGQGENIDRKDRWPKGPQDVLALEPPQQAAQTGGLG